MARELLKRGDLVEVLGPTEIFATLDDRGSIDNLPFMPEMAKYCGRRFRVDCRAERVCDTVHYSGSRRLADAVMLENLRCDGAAHGGCQADCRFIWKESWLRRIDPQSPPRDRFSTTELDALATQVSSYVRHSVQGGNGTEVRWYCQTTELLNCTTGVPPLDVNSYVREFTCGNVSLPKFLRVMAKGTIWEPLRKLGPLTADGLLRGTRTQPVIDPPLGLQAGEWVRVKSAAQIATTLSSSGHNRGLSFDREMLPFCGKIFRVDRRVTHVIDDRNGKMIEIKSDCIALERVACSGECSIRRLFCPRGIRSFWRECWLERVEPERTSA